MKNLKSVTDPKNGKRVSFLSRLEAKRELGISEATFHKYINILISSWGRKFKYIPRQTHWSDYQIYCIAFVKSLFKTGRNELEVIDYITQYKIPEPEDNCSTNNNNPNF